MRILVVLGLLGGLALLAALVLHFGAADILHAIGTLGWGGFALVVGVHLGLVLVMATGWWALGAGRPDARWPRFVWGRLVREAASETLPLSQVGGFVLGVRAAVLAGVAGAFATASMVVDVGVELVSQLGYTLLGVCCLWLLRPDSALILPVLGGLAFMAVLAALFVLLQARGATVVENLLARVAQGWLGDRGGTRVAVDAEIRGMHRHPRRLAASLVCHGAGWLLNGVETWLILRLVGAGVGVMEAIVIDSMLYGLRSLAFFVPNALGVQEGGYVMLGAIFGVPADAALAVSLIRRGRDLVIGVPVLAAWQVVESAALSRRARAGRAAPPPPAATADAMASSASRPRPRA